MAAMPIPLWCRYDLSEDSLAWMISIYNKALAKEWTVCSHFNFKQSLNFKEKIRICNKENARRGLCSVFVSQGCFWVNYVKGVKSVITWGLFVRSCFNRTLSMYVSLVFIDENKRFLSLSLKCNLVKIDNYLWMYLYLEEVCLQFNQYYEIYLNKNFLQMCTYLILN